MKSKIARTATISSKCCQSGRGSKLTAKGRTATKKPMFVYLPMFSLAFMPARKLSRDILTLSTCRFSRRISSMTGMLKTIFLPRIVSPARTAT